MRRFLSLIFLLLSIHGFAQYKTVYPDRTTFYKYKGYQRLGMVGNTGEYIPLKIESTSLKGKDTLYFNYRIFGNSPSGQIDCPMSHNAFAWTGREILMLEDQREVFINKEKDSVIFHKYADINDSWIFYSKGDTYFEATVVKKEVENINIQEVEVSDSVMTISIYFKKRSDNSIVPHEFNGIQWKISKIFGFVKTYDLLNFPKDISSLNIVGVDKLNLGVNNLTEKDIYDFEIGDEFHIREYDGGRNKKVIQKVLDKSFTKDEDTLIYKISVVENFAKGRYYQDGVLVEDIVVKLDTTYLKVSLYPDQKGMSEIPGKGYNFKYDSWVFPTYNYQFIQVEPPSVMVKALDFANNYTQYNDSCFDIALSGAFRLDKYEFWKGLGGPYFYSVRDLNISVPLGRELLYYKKTYEEWGTPMNLVMSTFSNKITAAVSLSPNPATDRLFISSEGIQNTSYKVFNVEGREVLNGNFIGTEETVDVNTLKAGIYSMMILNGGGIIYTSRFVKN
jgi:hypothetical protein